MYPYPQLTMLQRSNGSPHGWQLQTIKFSRMLGGRPRAKVIGTYYGPNLTQNLKMASGFNKMTLRLFHAIQLTWNFNSVFDMSELSVGVSVKDADRGIVFPRLINLFGIILRYVTILSDLKSMNFRAKQFNPVLNVRRSIKIQFT